MSERLIEPSTERAFVAALISAPSMRDSVSNIGLPELADMHAISAFTAFANLRSKGSEVTPATVRAEIERNVTFKRKAMGEDTSAAVDLAWFDAFVFAVKPIEMVLGWARRISSLARKREEALGAESKAAEVEAEIDEFAMRDVEPAPSLVFGKPVAHVGYFDRAPARLVGEQQERAENAAKAIRYHNAFLDDCCRKLLPHDLVLLGAPSGIGKTDLALNISTSNAMHGKNVHYFALEAEPRELERRTKFALLSQAAYAKQAAYGGQGHPQRDKLNFTDWMGGDCEGIVAEYNADVEQQIGERLRNLWTFYRGQDFDAKDLRARILEIHKQTDLIVVDHLHYIDTPDDGDHAALGAVVKDIRDVTLLVGKPVILIAHMRKRDRGAKQIVASIDDFHGSSNITKIATHVVTLENASDVETAKWWQAPTYIVVHKDRRGGKPPFFALSYFDRRTKSYGAKYTLGRAARGGTEFEAVPLGDQPGWARNHVAQEVL
jgi:hypothetical protein